MEKYAEMSLNDFSAALASKEAVPGGGGAAAVAGALAAALGGMVCNLSAGKKSCAEHAEFIAKALEELELTRKYMLRLADEDAKAFAPLKKYLSLPKDDPERAAHMDSALRVACFIPTEILYTAARTAELLNILINAAGMSDEVFAMTLRRECELVFEQYGPVIDSGLAAVEARIG